MNNFYVYAHSAKNNNDRIFYIGKGKGNRLNSKHGRNQYWKRIVAKYGYEAYKLEENLTEEQAFIAEKQYIVLLKGLGYSLVNMTDGGEGTSGWIPSEETRRKLSIASKGRKHSIETKASLSKAHTGKKLSPEHKAKLSILLMGRVSPMKGKVPHNKGKPSPFRGIKLSEEVRANMSRAQKGHKAILVRPILCHQNNTAYPSIKAAAEALNLHKSNISLVLSGKYKQTQSYTFEYIT
jgi:hypothetical protein